MNTWTSWKSLINFSLIFGVALQLIDGEKLYTDRTIIKTWSNTFKKMYPYEIEYLKEFYRKIQKTQTYG